MLGSAVVPGEFFPGDHRFPVGWGEDGNAVDRAGQMEILQVASDGRVQLKPRRPRYLRDEIP